MEINLAGIIATLINFAILVGLIIGIVFLLKKFSEEHKAKLRRDKAIEEKLDRILEKLEKKN